MARARRSYSGQQVNFFKNTEYRGLLCGLFNRAREVKVQAYAPR
jgi:hypothetical protein